MLNVGLTSISKFTGREFPKSERNRAAKSTALNRYMLKAEEICLNNENMPNAELKELLKKELFGKGGRVRAKSLASYIEEYAGRAASPGTARLYMATAGRVGEFDASATFESVGLDWLEMFYRHLSWKMKVNSAAIEMRNIRAVFNRAIDDGITSNYPFRRFKIKTEATRKRNLTAEQIRQLKGYPVDGWLEEYRDLWMLQFYLIGINISDLLELKSLTDGRCVYHRKKTGRLYDIAVQPEAMEIIERYRGENWLLDPLDRYRDSLEYARHMDRALKKIGPHATVPDKVGKLRKIEYEPLFPSLSTYWNRHSWASVAAYIDIPKEVIGKALGHSEWDNTTTDIYIEFDNRKIDDANRKVIDYVLYGKDYRKKQ